jgi:diguanylate cyclase (GGDEF)-like protein
MADGWTNTCSNRMLEVVAEPQRILSPVDPQDRWISITRRVLGGSFGLLLAAAGLMVVAGGARPLGLLILGLVAIVGGSAWLHRRAVASQDRHRRNEAETFARILQGLSRSISPAAIVEAMLGDLGRVAEADHCVVVRIEPAGGPPIATLVSMRPGVPSATTTLPSVLVNRWLASSPDRDDAPSPTTATRPTSATNATPASTGATTATTATNEPDDVTEQLVEGAERAFGLGNTLSVPLRHDGVVIGVIILSRRSAEPWPAATERVLAAAAIEASAALGRVDSTRAAEAQASTDVLTGLPNRRYFEEFCSLLGQVNGPGNPLEVGVLMVDIDWFKRINDTFGHAVGDEVLRAVAAAIAAAVRDGDVPARFGGEEFAVLIRHATRPIALEVAERVRLAVSQLDLRQWRVPGVSVSVGVAVNGRPAEPIGDLLVAADQALYRAKRAGRNQVVAA